MTTKVYDFRNPNYIPIIPDVKTASSRAAKNIVNQCNVCRCYNNIIVDQEDYDLWHGTPTTPGKMIHEVFPWLSANEREVLKTGIHSKCWDDIFEA